MSGNRIETNSILAENSSLAIIAKKFEKEDNEMPSGPNDYNLVADTVTDVVDGLVDFFFDWSIDDSDNENDHCHCEDDE